MTKDPSLASGKVILRAGDRRRHIPYAEHESRNGVLEVVVGKHRLDAAALIELAEGLARNEMDLDEGRALYRKLAGNLCMTLEAEAEEMYPRHPIRVRQALPDESDDEDGCYLRQRIREEGDLVAYQDWDSGGPGAGAGRTEIYLYRKRYYVLHDAGEDEYDDAFEALKCNGFLDADGNVYANADEFEYDDEAEDEDTGTRRDPDDCVIDTWVTDKLHAVVKRRQRQFARQQARAKGAKGG